jgi:hypothetical protein
VTTDDFLSSLELSLELKDELFVVFSRDGILQPPCVDFLQKAYSDQFRIIAPSSVPTVEGLHSLNRSNALETGLIERSYQVLRRFMRLTSWPKILIINNMESISADQALALRGCLSEQEWDKASDWPESIILVLKRGNGLSADLKKFVRAVINPDAVIGED